jgi:hypothetical protein
MDATIIRLTNQITLIEHSDTHRSADGTTRNDELDTLIPLQTVDATCGNEGRRILGTTQDLK